MAYIFNCPSCGRRRKAPAEYAGRKVRCVSCSHTIRIPMQPDEKPSEAPAASTDLLHLGSSFPLDADLTDPLQTNFADSLDALPPAPSANRRVSASDKMDPQTKWLLIGSFGVAGGVLLFLSTLILASTLSRQEESSHRHRSTATAASPRSEEKPTTSASASPVSAPSEEVQSAATSPSPARAEESSLPATAVEPAAEPTPEIATVADVGEPAAPALSTPSADALSAATPQSDAASRKPALATSAESTAAAEQASAQRPAASAERHPNAAGLEDAEAWGQDFEEAKRLATSEGKDILIVFSGSDWCGWSIRLNYEVFFQPKFHEHVRDQYILVMVDFPKEPANRRKVQDPVRNQQLRDHFGATGYPTIVLTDAQGRPYGFENYVQGGVSAFVQALRRHQTILQQRDHALSRIESASGVAKLTPIRECLNLLGENDLLPYYSDLLKDCTQTALAHDPTNQQGVYEVVFQSRWLAQLTKADQEDKQALLQLAGALDVWDRQCDFQDPDRGAMMHLLAGYCLLQAGDERLPDAALHFEAGLAYNPQDQELATQLKLLATLGDDHLTGTGFVVSSDGYVLTNQHVIEGPGRIAVQVEGQSPMPAEVVEQDSDRDLALLRVKAPRGVRLRPVVFGAYEARRGQEVAALGYPMGNPSMILTRGGVSGRDREGFLVLDCLVNPGNSGGPLCDSAGRVIGMVTAKSVNSESVSSYGLALPADVVWNFLKRSLPGDAPRVQRRDGRNSGWERVNDQVAPSVVMIVRSLSGEAESGTGAIAGRKQGPSNAGEPAPQRPRDRSPQPAHPTPRPRNATPNKPHWLIPPEPNGPQKFAPTGELAALDLSEHFNTKLDEGSPDYPENHWRDLPRGEQMFAGVKFHVGEGTVQLQGGRYWNDRPERVEIPVGKRLSNLYLLHATQANLPGPTAVGSITFRYRDGDSATHDLVYKRNVADGWLRWKPQPLPQAAFAWVGDNPAAGALNYRLSLYATRLVNPYPEKEVEAIIYRSSSHPQCAPFCMAMTIEQSVGSAAAATSQADRN